MPNRRKEIMLHEPLVFPKRTMHLDFHTGPDVPVGQDFNAQEFARMVKDAKIDSVTVFAMCHHGLLYYDTNHPARHPGLAKGLHLLEEQVEALHAVGVRAPIYLSGQCNEWAANEHKDWICLDKERRMVGGRGGNPFDCGWQIMDMASPYQDFWADIFDEVLRKFAPVDGIFMDMMWDQPSYTKWRYDAMKKLGLDMASDADQSKYSRMLVHEYMARYTNMLEAAQTTPAGIWYNSRPKSFLHEERKYVRHVEVECVPTGGWGYMYFPYVARFVRTYDLPTLSHTTRFFRSWGDTAGWKPEMALKYECCQILSQGMTNGIGDLMPPNGKLAQPVYDFIGRIYSHIAACEPYVEDAKPVSQIALVVNPDHGDRPGGEGIGALRMLLQAQLQFDVIALQREQDIFNRYELLIIPGSVCDVGDAFKAKLQAFIAQGGAVIFSGYAGFAGDARDAALLPEQGVQSEGLSPYTDVFVHPGADLREGLEDYGYHLGKGGVRAKAAAGAQSLVQLGEPYFQRSYDRFCGHSYTPEQGITDYAAVIQNGQVITFAQPLFEAYYDNAMPTYRQIFVNCVKRLITPIFTIGAGSRLEATVVQNSKATVVHMLSFCPERRDNVEVVEDAIPVVDAPVTLRLAKKPSRVYLAPNEKDLPFTYEDGVLKTTVSFLGGHAMLVAENQAEG